MSSGYVPSQAGESGLLSVIVSAHKYRPYLIDAFQSLADQTAGKDTFETIVVKNFEDSQVKESIKRFRFSTVTVDGSWIGPKLAAGLRASKGEIICFLDDDDRFAPDKLRQISRLFGAHPDLGYVHNNFEVIDRAGQVQSNSPFKLKARTNRAAAGTILIESKAILQLVSTLPPLAADFGMSCISVRRSVVERFLPILEGITVSPEPFLLVANLLSNVSICLTPGALTQYRLHGDNVSLIDPNTSTDMMISRLGAYYSLVQGSQDSLLSMVSGEVPSQVRAEVEGRIRLNAYREAFFSPKPSRPRLLGELIRVMSAPRSSNFRDERTTLLAGLLYLLDPSVARKLYVERLSDSVGSYA